ncbi:MAG: elongation factor Ts [Chlamydiales bacterium]|nr:elongation factor Ts [Chlamydiales bacterium]
MTEITAQMLRELRERTGVGMGKCKEALTESNGDIEKAIANLRKAGMASAVKKESREANEGLIYVFEDKGQVAIVEVNAETDFVVKNERFQEFAKNIAEEICATAPATLDAFMEQKYTKDPKLTVDEYRSITIQSLGENIKIKRFELFPKKAGHSMATYSHMGGKLVTMVELAGAEDKQTLAKDIAMHVAAECPEYITPDEVPERVIEHEKDIARAQVKNKPENIVEKILEGKLNAYFNQVCLLYQKYVKNPDQTIEQLIGKDLKISQFLRWRVGE